MYKCHQIVKSQVTDYVPVFFSLSPHNTKYTAPKESVIFIDEKIRTGLCSIACYMYAFKIYVKQSTSLSKKDGSNLLIEQA